MPSRCKLGQGCLSASPTLQGSIPRPHVAFDEPLQWEIGVVGLSRFGPVNYSILTSHETGIYFGAFGSNEWSSMQAT